MSLAVRKARIRLSDILGDPIWGFGTGCISEKIRYPVELKPGRANERSVEFLAQLLGELDLKQFRSSRKPSMFVG